MSGAWMTPARARALAGAAEGLALRVDEARTARTEDADEARRRAGFRLEEVAGDLRRAAGQLLATAEDLARLGSRPGGACSVPSGVCPEDGPTVSQSGGEVWCNEPGCGRRWGWHRLTMPCTELVAYRVTFTSGETVEVCAGHAIEARQRVAGSIVTSLT